MSTEVRNRFIHRCGDVKQLLLVMITFLVGCIAEGRGPEEWVRGSLIEGEAVTCILRSQDDSVFVATTQQDDILKMGYLLNVHAGNGMPPVAFAVSWKFSSANEGDLGESTQPRVVKNGYVKRDGKWFAEEVVYRKVLLSTIDVLNMDVFTKKFTNGQPPSTPLPNTEMDYLGRCEMAIE